MTPTLEAVEQLVEQLSEQDQRTLVQHLEGKWQTVLPPSTVDIAEQKATRVKRLRLAEQLLAEVADIEDDSQGTSDSVEILRCLREGRRD